jgi:hypothetical protein
MPIFQKKSPKGIFKILEEPSYYRLPGTYFHTPLQKVRGFGFTWLRAVTAIKKYSYGNPSSIEKFDP